MRGDIDEIGFRENAVDFFCPLFFLYLFHDDFRLSDIFHKSNERNLIAVFTTATFTTATFTTAGSET